MGATEDDAMRRVCSRTSGAELPGEITSSQSGSILWLPGWSASPDVWRETIETMPHGAHEVCDFALCEHPGDLLDTARAALIGLRAPVEVVGWSLGAMVALELAGIEPERIGTLALVSATDRFVGRSDGQKPDGEGGWPERILRRMQDRLRQDPVAVLEDFDRRMFTQAEREAGDDTRWIAGRDAVLPSIASLKSGLDYLCGFSARPDSVTAMVHMLHGSDDVICPLGGAQRLAAVLPRSELTVWEGSGHVPFWTRPAAFSRWLHDCLAT
jgi:pimeloyl-[acyl-carrier protein] methyl ester esterase